MTSSRAKPSSNRRTAGRQKKTSERGGSTTPAAAAKLRRELKAARAQLAAAIERQKATADILSAISHAPSEVQPVLDALVVAARRFCGADDALIMLRDGDEMVVAAHDGPVLSHIGMRGRLDRSRTTGRAIVDGTTVHAPDHDQLDPVEFAGTLERTRLNKAKASLTAPMLRNGAAVGSIILRRFEPGPFTPQQIELLETFAAQAVIALENTRLFSELTEALDQQTATAEILGVIAKSPSDVKPVLQVLVAAARRFCGATDAVIALRDGEDLVIAAHDGSVSATIGSRHRLDRSSVAGRAMIDGGTLHVPDFAGLDPVEFAGAFRLARGLPMRAMIAAPMMRDGRALGSLNLRKSEPGPFTDRQVALLESFAAQAVIALENTRLFSELQQRTDDLSESLEQQTATANVLHVISRSPTDVRPVLDSVAQAAVRLCGAEDVLIVLRDGDGFVTAAHEGPLGATIGVRLPLDSLTVPGAAIAGNRTIHFPDYDALDVEVFASARAYARMGGFKAAIGAPLLRDGQAIGAIVLRRRQPGPFSDRQIALLESFSAQAVIAVENTRLFTELHEALDQQTASAEILNVISQSPTDVQPVLAAVAKAAVRFCGAEDAVISLRDGDFWRVAGHEGAMPASIGNRRPLNRGSSPGRAIVDGKTVHLVDIPALDPAEFGMAQALSRRQGFRSAVAAPMMRAGRAVGAISLRRAEAGGFTPRQIELLESFAAQAVIALENTRLFTELHESLEQQTASAEILNVISRSPTDVQPVLDVVASAARRFCGATDALINLRDGDEVFTAAHDGPLSARLGARRPFDRSFSAGRAISDGRTIHIPDVSNVDPQEFATMHALAREHGFKATVAAPLMREGTGLGAIVLRKTEPGAFDPRQIALLESFAAQAVIALENTRLFSELHESLEQQTATSAVLQVINGSPGDLRPVFDAILEKAHSLCDAPCGSLQLYDGKMFRAVADRGLPEELAKIVRQGFRHPSVQLTGSDSSVTHIADAAEAFAQPHLAGDPAAQAVAQSGLRTMLFVPLHKEGVYLGRIVAARRDVRPFTDRQVELLRGFAAQAVIAMENARLLGELRESLEQQTATADVLKTISRSPVGLEGVLQTLVETVGRLCRADQSYLFRRQGELHHLAVAHGVSEEARQYIVDHPFAPSESTTSGRTALRREIVHIPDVLADPAYDYSGGQQVAGFRTMLGIPLMAHDQLVGVFVVSRTRVEPFSDKDIELASGFADQAVIAIENARLFEELRESLDRQTATSEVLQVISRSPGDLLPVFEAILASATRICGAQSGLMSLREGNGFRFQAGRNLPQDLRAWMIDRDPLPIAPGGAIERLVQTGEVVHLTDLGRESVDGMPASVRPPRSAAALASLAGAETILWVPMVKDAAVVGVIVIFRTEAQPFSPQQIDIVRNFASQAVIAIENTRLLGELRDRQAELRVTFDNMGDGVAMFDDRLRLAAWNRNFQELLEIPDAFLAAEPAYEGFIRLMVERGELGDGDFEGELGRRRAEFGRAWTIERTRPNGRILEVRNNPVPGGGAVLIYSDITERKRAEAEIRAARDAAEAALERQTATADILKVIASSPTDVQPVLDAVVAAAVRFCGAADAMLMLRDGDERIPAAHVGNIGFIRGRRLPLDRGTTSGRAILDGRTWHLPDVEALDAVEFAGVRGYGAQHGFRAALAAPLLRDSSAIGAVVLRKPEPGPFTPVQIQLLETFAAQAVIAIENVRLFTELRESLDRQTAMAEILRVISQSPTDVQPVLEAIAKAAVRFCGAPDAIVALREGDTTVTRAHEGALTATMGLRRPIDGVSSLGGRAIRERRTRQIADIAALDADEYASARELARQHGWRASAATPLLRESEPIGLIILRKPEPGLLSTQQISLLETFAAQAVIAIENVRLFTELRESLEQQTASAEILNAISRSPTDVQPVLDAVASAARRFCGATDAVINLRDGAEVLVAAHEGPLGATLHGRRPFDRSFAGGRAMSDGRTIHVPDVAALDPEEFRTTLALARQHGYKAAIATPLMREGVGIGAIVLRRQDAGEFGARQIELLETFAAQAVIAIENVRLFTELRESLDRLRAAQANLIQSEKMASLGQLTAGIAHEIKNPLNFVNNFASLSSELLDELKETVAALLAAPDDAKRAEMEETAELLTGNLGKIVEHGKRADGIVKSMLSHSRGGSGDWTPSDINALVEEALNLAYHGARAQDQSFNVTLERELAPGTLRIEVVPQDVTRVFLNLFSNGFYAANKRRLAAGPAGFKPVLRVATRDLGEAVEVRVRDNGTGIAPEVRDKLFQPFFTTKPTGEGTGLGLSISYDIVTQQHGGTIEVASEPGQFTEFTVRLPRARRIAEARGAQ